MKINFNLNKIIPFIIGLLISQNVIYVFKISNTYINIIQLFCFVVLLFSILFNKTDIKNAIKKIDKSFIYFFLIILFSIIQYFFTVTFILSDDKIYGFFSGLISMFLFFCIYFCVLLFSNNQKYLIKGMKLGFVCNIIFSLLELLFFNEGSYFSLYNFFPQDFYYVSIPWHNRNLLLNNDYLIYSYRASGLFLESSHYIAYVSCIFLILFTYKNKNTSNNGFIYKLLFVLLIGLLIFSYSGTIAALFVALLVFYIFKLVLFKNIKINRKKLMLFFVGFNVFFILLLVFNNTTTIIWDVLLSSFNDSSLLAKDNSTRMLFMSNAVDCIFHYPLGIGYNMAPVVLNQLYGTYSTFNYFLSVILELGPIGLISYLFIFFSNIRWIVKNKKNNYDLSLLTALFVIMLVQFFNGISFTTPYIAVIFGLIQINKFSKTKEDDFNEI